ncbi:MAG: DUF2789 family protein [Vibrio sp.]
MEMHHHTMQSLFAQLGLNDSQQGIQQFIDTHKNQLGKQELHQASFWNNSQAQFLEQAKLNDADWAEVVDQLDAMLRMK